MPQPRWAPSSLRAVAWPLLRTATRSRSSVAAVLPRVEALRTRLAEEAASEVHDFVPNLPSKRHAQISPMPPPDAARADLSALSPQQLPVPPNPMLFDRFARHHTYLRLSLTEKCSLRCVYCMPEQGVSLTPNTRLLSIDETMRLARVFVGAGVTKIRLTGGEPTVRRDLPDVVAALSELRPLGLEQIAMTSNGIALPRMLPSLVLNGLDKLNLSLDTLDRQKFITLTRRDGLKKVLAAIDLAIDLGIRPLKLNCVLMAGTNDDELLDFAALSRDRPIDVRFIEYMPFDGNRWDADAMVPFSSLLARVKEAHPGTQKLPTPPNDVAVSWKLPDAEGSVSFIASMTQPFCAGCNRLRLTADGALKVCLFGNEEISLRDAMREVSPHRPSHPIIYEPLALTIPTYRACAQGASDGELMELVGGALAGKHAAHAGMHALAASENRPMTTIGG